MSEVEEGQPLLNISNLTVEYNIESQQTITAVRNINLSIGSNQTIGIVGQSGSGKTTLGLSILKLIQPPGRIAQGALIEYKRKNILVMSRADLRRYRWKEVAMIYQSAMNSLNPVKRVSSHIVEVLRQHTEISKQEARALSLELLSEVGISSERAGNYPHEFSGGLKQRAVIALALSLSPKLLIADEPTSALDVVTQKQILELLKSEVSSRGLSLLLITHEISLLQDLVKKVVVMFGGEIVEIGPLDSVLNDPLHPYTETLLSTVLTMKSGPEVLLQIASRSGETDSIVLAASGCKYANRCKYAFQRCRTEEPELRNIGKDRWVSCHKY